MSLQRSLAEQAELRHVHTPLIFDRSLAHEREAMEELLRAEGAVCFAHDTVAQQLNDLVETRNPARQIYQDVVEAGLVQRKRRLPSDVRAAEVARLTRGQPLEDYGRWVYYPWAKRLVHVLPPSDFHELRTDRNRNKLTREEQQRLAGLKVAIAGLSVGSAVALTLALEGTCGELRLADFDELDLSNLNRLRGGVHDIGVNKAVLAARAIVEQNPFAKVKVYEEGVTKENVEALLIGDGGVDVLVEECDSFYMKLYLREEARAHRIPVIMETSDRGMIDVERFDEEPERPIFHGLLGDIRADDLLGLTAREKVPYFMAIVGERMTLRMAASLVEVEQTVSGWPQLGADVTLGGASVTVAVRRLGLGKALPSGRAYVDLDELVTSVSQPKPPSYLAPASAPPSRRTLAKASGDGDERAFVRRIVERATLAPSAGNNQPWRFHYAGGELTLHLDRSRCENSLDIEQRASLVAVGAALEHLVVAAAAEGFTSDVVLLDELDADGRCAKLRFAAGKPSEQRHAEQIGRRATNRHLCERASLDEEDTRALASTAAFLGVTATFVDAQQDRAELGRVLGAGDRLRYLLPRLHRELMSEVRFTPEEAERARDGLDLRAFELDAADRAAMEIIRDPDVVKLVRSVNGGAALEEGSMKQCAAASALCVLHAKSRTARDYLAGGRAVARFWWEASARGIAVYPMTPLFTYMHAGTRDGEELFDAATFRDVDALRDRFLRLYGLSDDESVLIHLKLARAPLPSIETLRRPLDEVLTFG